MRRRVLRRLIRVFTVCSGLSVRIHTFNRVFLFIIFTKLYIAQMLSERSAHALTKLLMLAPWSEHAQFTRAVITQLTFRDNFLSQFQFVLIESLAGFETKTVMDLVCIWCWINFFPRQSSVNFSWTQRMRNRRDVISEKKRALKFRVCLLKLQYMN